MGSFFLFGPRGTGKSTWIRYSLPCALKPDLLQPDVFRIYSARPKKLKDLVRGASAKSSIIIDEIQKIPDLLDVVHYLIEEEPTRRFIQTGSSTRKLKSAGVYLMAGRAVVKKLTPFMAAKMGTHFDLSRALKQGMLPLVWGSLDPFCNYKRPVF